MIEIVDYRSTWPDEFHRLGSRIRDVLGARALRIDHIGSTAVPGLAAKDIIDVQVTVGAFDSDLLADLAKADLTQLPHITADHTPPGMSVAPEELEKRFFAAHGAAQRTANVHLRIAGRLNQRYPLLWRDYLRATPAVARAYGEVKRSLARLVADDAEAYYAVKDPVFDITIAGADAWAQLTGWQPGPSDA